MSFNVLIHYSWSRLLLCLLLATTATATYGQANHDGQTSMVLQDWYADYNNNRFAIEVPLTQNNTQRLQQRLQTFRYSVFYSSIAQISGISQPSFRIGFFGSREQAEQMVKAMDFLLTQHKVVPVTPEEHKIIASALSGESIASDYFILTIDDEGLGISSKVSAEILERGKSNYIERRYQEAANYYMFLSTFGEQASAMWAMELLGLCYEKQGDFDGAIDTYRSLLLRFPDNKDSARVEQRLRGLETAAMQGRKSRQVAVGQQKSPTFFTRGMFGQYYRTLTRSVNDGPDVEGLSLLTTDWDLRTSLQFGNHTIRSRINGYAAQDRLEGGENDNRLKRLYIDYQHATSGLQVIGGRQKDFDSGVFTSFDGLTVSYPVVNSVRVYASAGNPVYFSGVLEELDYSFYSVHATWDINQRWRLNSYIVEQTVNDLTDRQALGLSGQFRSETASTSLAIDYDQAFAELNNLLWTGSYQLLDGMTLTAMVGKQRSPFLTATNILIGQTNQDIDLYLASQQNEDALLDDALARTSSNAYYSLALNYKLSNRVQLNTDYYHSTLSEVPSAAFLTGQVTTPEYLNDFQYDSIGAQFVLSGALQKNDSTSIGIRRNSGDTSSSTQLTLSERMRFQNSLTVEPKFLFSTISFDTRAEDQLQWRLGLLVSYRLFRNTEINAEWGKDVLSNDSDSINSDSTYVYIGYRTNF